MWYSTDHSTLCSAFNGCTSLITCPRQFSNNGCTQKLVETWDASLHSTKVLRGSWTKPVQETGDKIVYLCVCCVDMVCVISRKGKRGILYYPSCWSHTPAEPVLLLCIYSSTQQYFYPGSSPAPGQIVCSASARNRLLPSCLPPCTLSLNHIYYRSSHTCQPSCSPPCCQHACLSSNPRGNSSVAQLCQPSSSCLSTSIPLFPYN